MNTKTKTRTKKQPKIGSKVTIETMDGLFECRIKDIPNPFFIVTDRPSNSGQVLFSLSDIVSVR